MIEGQLTENRVLMARAREALKGKWCLAVGSCLVFLLIVVLVQRVPHIGKILPFVVSGPMAVGWAALTLSLSRKEDARFGQLFEGFGRFGTAIGAYFLIILFVLLWSLLLIIPGIVAALAYAQTYYIIAEDDRIGPLAAIRKSKEIMRGKKWKLVCLGFRFIGWWLLCLLTLGIGFLWLMPYMAVSCAAFYNDLTRPETEEARMTA